MENKEIYIDGVDVSGCSALMEDYQRANNIEGRYEHIKNVCELGERGAEYYNLFCKDNPNCYYKQLKRKEQECATLREEKAYTDMACEQFEKQLQSKEQKLEKIKELLTTCKANSDILCCECKFSSQCEEEDTDTQILKIIEE